MAEAVEKKLPGRAKPAPAMLEEYETHRDTARRNAVDNGQAPVVADLLVDIHIGPPAADVLCWRVQLACGCLFEVLTSKTQQPHTIAHRDLHHQGHTLPVGQAWCRDTTHHLPPVEGPRRRIVSYDSREEITLPADPVEPDLELPPEVWARIRRDTPETFAEWTVSLECGHVGTQLTDLGWGPDDPREPRITEQRRVELPAELDEYDVGIDPEWVREGMPKPPPRVECSVCRSTSAVVAFQRLGPLKPGPRPPRAKKTKKQVLAEKLQQAEKEAARLRKQLEEEP